MLKRLLIVMACLLLLAGAGGAVAWRRLHGRPAWYPADAANPVARAAAARRADQTVNRAMNWTGDAQRRAALSSAAKAQPDLGPLEPLTLTFTQEELNAFFDEWDKAYGWSDQYKDHLTAPLIALHDHELILAATVNETETVVSIHLRPTLQDGVLRSDLRMTGGTLPLPKPLWKSYCEKLQRPLERNLPLLQSSARVQSDGSANNALVAASLSEMVLHILRGEGSDPILFLPYLQDFKRRTFPVKLTSLSIDQEQLTLTVEPLSGEERQALITRARQPYAAGQGQARASAQ